MRYYGLRTWHDVDQPWIHLQHQKPHYHRNIYRPSPYSWMDEGPERTVALLDSMCPVGLNTSNPSKRMQINPVHLNGILKPVISFLWCRVAACLLASNSKLEGGKKGSICARFVVHAPCTPVFSVYVYYLWICDSSGVQGWEGGVTMLSVVIQSQLCLINCCHFNPLSQIP